jgi:hypothetical protein
MLRPDNVLSHVAIGFKMERHPFNPMICQVSSRREKRTVLNCKNQSSFMGLSRFGLWVGIKVSNKKDGLGHSCTTCRSSYVAALLDLICTYTSYELFVGTVRCLLTRWRGYYSKLR